ncbi:MAG TPA: hypothetical protein VK624_07180 [Steroidobacteraceae bacterium]|nr:hypothetical protein [Steroidobacteraceae bacterium]
MLPKASSLLARSKKFVGVLLIAAVPVNAVANEIAVVGPIEEVNCLAQTVKILGVRFAADAVATATLCESGAFSVSSYVSATGEVDSTGGIRLRNLTAVPSTLYVPGASPVYVRGEVSIANPSTGEISLNGALIDSQSASASLGSIVEILGTQPLPNGSVLPLSLRVVVEKLTNDSSVGSGSEVNSSVGSGAALMSSVGSGTAKNSSVGSGAALMSSVGSGAAKNSSVGSGAALMSSVGSGTAKNSSVGSGAALMSSVGSGTAKNSSVGSGAALMSSVGSGAAKNSSVGSGSQINSSVGSGVALMSSVGSGAE